MLFTLIYTDKDVDGGGFHLDVEKGSKPEDHTCDQHGGFSTNVVLLCNSSAKWTDQNLGGNFYIYYDHLNPCVVSSTIVCITGKHLVSVNVLNSRANVLYAIYIPDKRPCGPK